jgi:Protein of unknown function (DUF616)
VGLVVFSSVYGDYEDPKPTGPSSLVERWVMYTDDPNLDAPGWDVRIEPRPGEPPFLAAKARKCHPPEDCAKSLWIDGSILVHSEQLFADALELLETCDLATFRHPYRDCILDEAVESEYTPRYRGQRVLWQAAKYMTQGHPRHWGLYSSGIIARNHTADVMLASHLWHNECRVTTQDQVSLPVIVRQAGLEVRLFDGLGRGGIYDNPSFTVVAHKLVLPMGTPEAAQ